MGNCQAIDNASLLIQHQNGRVDKLYWSVTANEIMKMHPGHYVALLLTTTICPSTSSSTTTTTTTTSSSKTTNNNSSSTDSKNNNLPVRVTRIKLLRPTDTLLLGHVYRLITTQEVMKGLWAKKYAKMKQQSESSEKLVNLTAKEIQEIEAAVRKYEMEKTSKTKHERHRSKASQSANSAAAKSRAWQPSLKSISEAAS